MTEDIHLDQPRLEINGGSDPPGKIVILLHGRGSTAQATAPLAKSLLVEDARMILPQAGKNRWYPNTAFGPLENNQPDLRSALSMINRLIEEFTSDGIPKEKIILGGFSQGACLAAEFVARNPDRYGGLFVFSGALIGPPKETRGIEGDVRGMPVFIGGSDRDPWVKHEWMKKAAQAFEGAGADVDFRTYPGMGHTVNEEELNAVRELLASI